MESERAQHMARNVGSVEGSTILNASVFHKIKHHKPNSIGHTVKHRDQDTGHSQDIDHRGQSIGHRRRQGHRQVKARITAIATRSSQMTVITVTCSQLTA